jgi:uncharacterized membrane protein YkoI
MISTCRRSILVQRILSLLITSVLVGLVCSTTGTFAANETKPEPAATAAPGKISQQQATQAALQALPGKVTDVTIERKLGKNVYVIEIVADKDGEETDVLVDMASGAVLGVEH